MSLLEVGNTAQHALPVCQWILLSLSVYEKEVYDLFCVFKTSRGPRRILTLQNTQTCSRWSRPEANTAGGLNMTSLVARGLTPPPCGEAFLRAEPSDPGSVKSAARVKARLTQVAPAQ